MVPREREILLLRNQLSEKNQLLGTQAKKAQDLSNQVYWLTQDNQNKNNQIASLKKRICQLQGEVESKKQQEVSSYEREMEHLKNQLFRKDQQLLSQIEKTQESTNQVNWLTQEVDKKKGRIEELVNDNSQLLVRLKLKEKELGQGNKEKTRLDGEITKVMKDLKDMQGELKGQVQLNSSLSLELNDLRKVIKEFQTRNMLLKNKLYEKIKTTDSEIKKSKTESILKKTILLNNIRSLCRSNGFDSGITESYKDDSQSFIGSERHLSISKLDFKEQNRELTNIIDYLRKENYKLFAQNQKLELGVEAIQYW
jgi:chromosome segregation ATPase